MAIELMERCWDYIRVNVPVFDYIYSSCWDILSSVYFLWVWMVSNSRDSLWIVMLGSRVGVD